MEAKTAGRVTKLLQHYKKDVEKELHNILTFWLRFCVDNEKGGFYGQLDNNNKVVTGAPKGSVLNSRILWTFSAAGSFHDNSGYITLATRAFEYISNNFYDNEFGGVYWMIDVDGRPLDTRKQIYALAFCIYGMSEYYAATQHKPALDMAIALFNTIEERSYDNNYKGYFEAFARNWGPLDDVRLSAKDANEKKTMNTHLHVIEAYCNLYKVWPGALLREKITALLEVFDAYMINKSSGHLELFFNEQWQVKPDVISYGHDIEAAWLLQQCAEIIGDDLWISVMKAHAVTISKAAAEGLDSDGGLWYEYNPQEKKLIKEKHWWPQAEAMVGFFNTWQIRGDEGFLHQSYNNWLFTKQYIIDNKHGEWYWGVTGDHEVMAGQDKAGFWKCPYHNARACMELIKRINKVN